MNKELSAKIQIFGKNSNNEYFPYEEGTLAYNIINNAIKSVNGTELLDTPKTKPAEEISGEFATGKYEVQTLTDQQLQYGFSPWLYADTEEAAKTGAEATSKSCADLIGKYIYDRSNTIENIFKIEGCDGETPKAKLEIIEPEKALSKVEDDYGTSYYFRGNPIDNYVNFAGMCWRIVRISGDGSIKLILEDQDEICSTTMNGNWSISTTPNGTTNKGNYGYKYYDTNSLISSDGTKNTNGINVMNYLNGGTYVNESMATTFKNFQGDENKLEGTLTNKIYNKHNKKLISDYLKVGDWCLGDTAYNTANDDTNSLTKQEVLDKKIKKEKIYYDSFVRLAGKTTKEPTLKCNGTNVMKFGDDTTPMYVGTLTADEIVYAGGKVDTDNRKYYLINDYQRKEMLNYFTLSPSAFYFSFTQINILWDDFVFKVQYTGHLLDDDAVSNNSFRPAIQLKSDVQISKGNGTIENPYIIAS